MVVRDFFLSQTIGCYKTMLSIRYMFDLSL